MKKVFIVAIATLALAMTACEQEEPITPNNNNNNNGTEITNARVKTTSDLHNTDWACSVSIADLLTNMFGTMPSCIDSLDGTAFESYLSFDGTHAHFTFSQNVELWGMDSNDEMQQMQGINYEYSYDGTTHTGYLVGMDENGNPANLNFTYDDNTDAITFTLQLYMPEDTTNTINYSMVYSRVSE